MNLFRHIGYTFFIVVVIAIGGHVMLDHSARAADFEYERYSSQDDAIGVEMDYPKDWKFSEHRGSYGSYAQAQFYGQTEAKILPSFVVNVRESSKVESEPKTIQAMTDDIVEKRLMLKEAKIVSRKELEVADNPAVEIVLTYEELSDPHTVNPEFLPVKERTILFQNADRFYDISYTYLEKNFSDYADAFEHCLESLKLK